MKSVSIPASVPLRRIRQLVAVVLLSVISLGLQAQNKPVSINVSDMTVESILQKLRKENPSYRFLFNHEEVKNKGTKTVRLSNAPISQVLESVLDDTGLSFSIEKNVIVIKPSGSRKDDSFTIQGHVTDSDGEPLTGVSVRIKSTGRGCATDLDGNFSLKVPGEKAVLLVSMIGMTPQEITVGKKRNFSIMMTEDNKLMSEVVVTGYQVIDKRASTSAITSIKAEDVLRPDAISIDQMLEGQIPDLMYMSNSGEAAVAPKIRIRGTSSIIGNREPLWVVDGIVVNDPVAISAEDLNDPDYVNRIGNAIAGLNPQDIERLDVLKDASATALYGTKAANGVIVITTKRGQEGPTTIRYTNSLTWKRRPRYTDHSVDVMNSAERIQLSRELFAQHYNYDLTCSLVGYELALDRFYKGLIDADEFDREVSMYENVNTDWFDLLTHDSFSQQHTVNISGGNSRASYYASIGFTDNDDIVKGTSNRRYNAMANLDFKFSNFLTAAFSIQGNVSNKEYFQDNLAPVQSAYKTTRALPAKDENGELFYYNRLNAISGSEGYNYNILNELANSGVDQDGTSVTFNANLRFRFTDWLSANAIFSYTDANTEIESYWGESTWYAATLRKSEYGVTPGASSLMPKGGQLTVNQTHQKNWTARLQLDWNKYFDDETHNFAGGIGVEAIQNKYHGYANITRGYMPERGLSFVQGIDLEKYTSYRGWLANNVPTLTDSKSNTLSAYLSLSYNYNRLIYLNFNARVDGSNNFGDKSNDKLLPIWSVSGSFDASRLGLFRELTWLDQFSIKASYGFQGNMLSDQTPVLIVRKGAYNDYIGEFTSTVVRNPNPDLKWEKTTSYNLGLVWSFFDRKFQLEADMYWKRTRDAFMTKTISTVNGYNSYTVNGGDISNDGYSVAITVRPVQTRDWQWSLSTVLSKTINRIKSTPAGEQYELDNFLNGSAVVEGKPIGTFYSYKFLGLNPTDGGPMFDDWRDHYYDLMGLSKYDTYTRVLKATGSREPVMSGSFRTQLRWKSIRMSANFAYSLGAKTRLFGMYGVGAGTDGVYAKEGQIRPENNLSRDYIGRWMKPGDEKHTNIPAIIPQGSPSYYEYQQHFSSMMTSEGIQKIADNYWDMYDYSDIRVVSSDYLKLSTLSISYDLPAKWLNPWGVRRLEVTASGTNLFTICDSKLKGQTPTQGGFSNIQLSDRPGYSIGLSVTF